MEAKQAKTKILVIDDERLIRMTLSAKLKLIGYVAICVASTQEAVALLNNGGHKQFKAIITDIMMGDMDGFVFRDILRGMDPDMPIFFITALDPEEGSGFLKRIMEDNYSFYLPKSVKTDTLLKRVQSIVTSRRVSEIIEEQKKDTNEALQLASHLQNSMLPARVKLTDEDFYTTWWNPKDQVSGDLFEVIPLQDGGNLYILGDVQGHGPAAALSMMAVQSFLKQLSTRDNFSMENPVSIANQMQVFFKNNLGSYSYMTALICMHHPKQQMVEWISCGAPDLLVIDPEAPNSLAINPEKRGNLPIGMLEDTVYTDNDVVQTKLSKTAICVAFTDGMIDVYKDEDGHEQMPEELLRQIQVELLVDARLNGSIPAALYKFQMVAEAYGYSYFTDDMTEIIFGARLKKKGFFEKTVQINVIAIDKMAQEIDNWCNEEGWDPSLATKVQLVFEEKLMNLHDHGYDIRDKSKAYASIRLKKSKNLAELAIWDDGTPEPGLSVIAGSLDTELELKNRQFSGRGRGRLMLREICSGIKRNRYGNLNETIYFIPLEDMQNEGETK